LQVPTPCLGTPRHNGDTAGHQTIPRLERCGQRVSKTFHIANLPVPTTGSINLRTWLASRTSGDAGPWTDIFLGKQGRVKEKAAKIHVMRWKDFIFSYSRCSNRSFCPRPTVACVPHLASFVPPNRSATTTTTTTTLASVGDLLWKILHRAFEQTHLAPSRSRNTSQAQS